jgi:RNA polymerase sigma-70 factor (ECF subfamily)
MEAPHLSQLHDPATKEKAFRQLIQAYQEKLYYHIRRFVRHHEDANDVLQNTFIKIWNGVDHFRGESALYTWVYRIATNESLSYINKVRRLNVVDIDQSPAAHRSGSDGESAEQLQQKLDQALAQLPDRQRQVFIMRYYDELTYEQISEILETSVGALKASYHHAVKKIEESLLAH